MVHADMEEADTPHLPYLLRHGTERRGEENANAYECGAPVYHQETAGAHS
jgi:hypothetical protein